MGTFLNWVCYKGDGAGFLYLLLLVDMDGWLAGMIVTIIFTENSIDESCGIIIQI